MKYQKDGDVEVSAELSRYLEAAEVDPHQIPAGAARDGSEAGES